MSDFKSLGLSESLLAVLSQMGFEKPTPIQSQAIPMLLQDKHVDMIGQAQTGTGKTAAFGLPLVELVDIDSPDVQALVVAPTRELGQQIAEQLKQFSKAIPQMEVVSVYGGANISTQIKALRRKVQIVVATPGRLLDLMRRKAISLEAVRTVVLDEADEMLQMVFKEDIDAILAAVPEERSIWLFSATMPKEIRRIINRFMDEPTEIKVNHEEKTNTDITHQFVVTQVKNKLSAIRRFLDIQPEMRGVMFCRTRRETQQIADDLGDLGYGVEALHGDLSQAQRDAVMKRFKNRGLQLLVATDVAARGIDVNDLTHVLHHTLPDQLESYTHRSGRTGRAGKKGISLAFINGREGRKIDHLEKQMGVVFERVQVPSMSEVRDLRLASWAKGILKEEVHGDIDSVMKELGNFFAGIDKEELIRRLASRQLTMLVHEGMDQADLNETSGNTLQRKNPDAHRYFVNIGSNDQVTIDDIKEFLSEVGEVSQSAFSNFSLQKKCCFFDLDKKKDKGFALAFQGLIVEGRKIRLNRDDDGQRGSRRDGGRSGHRGKRISNTRGGNRSGGGRGRGNSRSSGGAKGRHRGKRR